MRLEGQLSSGAVRVAVGDLTVREVMGGVNGGFAIWYEDCRTWGKWGMCWGYLGCSGRPGVRLEGQLSSGAVRVAVGDLTVREVMGGVNGGFAIWYEDCRTWGKWGMCWGYLGCSGRPGVRLEGQLSSGAVRVAVGDLTVREVMGGVNIGEVAIWDEDCRTWGKWGMCWGYLGRGRWCVWGRVDMKTVAGDEREKKCGFKFCRKLQNIKSNS